MKTVRIVAIILTVVVVLLLGFSGYMGLFRSMDIEEKVMGPYTIVYERHLGDYRQIGKVLQAVDAKAQKAGLHSFLGLAAYYDDPSNTPVDKLRSDCGFVIAKQDFSKKGALQKILKIKNIPSKKCMVTEFPIRNVFSYLFGPFKAYPALKAYAHKKGYRVTMSYELYNMKEGKIYYYIPVK